MRTRILTVIAVALLLGSTALAQQPQPQSQPQPQPAPAKPAVPPAPSIDQPNVRFDITLSDEGGGITPVSKSVVLMVQGNGAGSLRSGGVGYLTNVPSNIGSNRGERVAVDLFADVTLARYELRTPDKIRARVAVDYQPFSSEWKGVPGRVRAQVDVMLDNGKETTLWQTTDPVMGVRTTIKVTATVLK
jgi:hypothetical protein